MSTDNNDNDKKPKSGIDFDFKEELLKEIPEGILGPKKKKEIDLTTASFEEIFEASRFEELMLPLVRDPEQREYFSKAISAIVANKERQWEKLREKMKDPEIRKGIIQGMIDKLGQEQK